MADYKCSGQRDKIYSIDSVGADDSMCCLNSSEEQMFQLGSVANSTMYVNKRMIFLKFHLEPLAEVERALLVVKILQTPDPELGGLLLGGGEHFLQAGCSDSTTITRPIMCA
jgi:hypothetical protein